jgi:hypothetical protein
MKLNTLKANRRTIFDYQSAISDSVWPRQMMNIQFGRDVKIKLIFGIWGKVIRATNVRSIIYWDV